MHDDIDHILIPAEHLQAKVREMGEQIARDYMPLGDLLLVGVLKGCIMFIVDLARAIPMALALDFIAISSYGKSTESSGVVRLLKDLDTDIAGRDVLIVEDIVDTGLTLSYLRRTLRARVPRGLRTIALLDRTARRIVPVPIEYRGFEIGDVFVVGYGLDWRGRYRNLRELYTVEDAARLAAEGSALEALSPRR